ncbi:MAG: ADP-ribosylglycohydrolase family protein [Promethearchaeota archaeon]
MNELESKILGCLMGSAIGNAMGSIVENWDYNRIEKTYGKIMMPLMLDRILTEDDYQIAMLYTQCYLENQRNITPEDFAATWIKDFKDADNFFWCLRNALELLRRGVSPRQSGMYNINTGSAIMSIFPVGIYNMLDPDRAYADALDLAYMYQPKPDAFCAAAMASGYALAFKPGVTPDEICTGILSHSLNEALQYWDDRKINNIHESVEIAINIAEKYGTDWWAARKEIYEKLTQWHPIEPVEVLSITTCLFKMTGGNYTEGVIAGTNIGRDSDTIANLIGGLCGAMNGIDAIPLEWREGVQEINPALYSKLENLAKGLANLISKKIKKTKNALMEIESLLGSQTRDP